MLIVHIGLTLHLQYRERLEDVIIEQFELLESQLHVYSADNTLLIRVRLSFWGLRKSSLQLSTPPAAEYSGPLVYNGPPRVLEIGCGDGTWCFKIREEQPEWILEGIDDTDHVGVFL